MRLKDFTASLIFGACQLGITVNIEDLSIHTLLAVNEYAAKVMDSKGRNVEPPTSLSELRQLGKTKG